MIDLLCMGMALIDCLHSPDGTTKNLPGGEAVNEVLAAKRLGLNAGIACGLCRDNAGQEIRTLLENNGVGTEYVTEPGKNEPDIHSTPVTQIYLDENGQRTSKLSDAHKLLYYHPENELNRYPESKIVSLCSLFRAPFVEPEAIYKTAGYFKKQGAVLLADTKTTKFVDIGLEDIRDTLPLIDYIFPNETESEFYTKEKDPEKAADVFLKAGVKNVIIKLGDKGAVFKNEREYIKVPAFNVAAIDATGAGDNFIAGWSCALLESGDGGKINHEYAMRFASACAALNVIRPGGISGAKNKQEALDML